jgi:hypothetical protein
MYNLARCFVMLMIISVGSNLYAQEWIAYQEPVQPVVQTQVVYVQQPQPIVIYQWVPYVVQQNVIVEQQKLFCRTQTVVTRPYTQWIMQPVVIYR